MALSDCPPTIRIVKLGNPDAERDAINAAFQAVTRCLGEMAIPDQTGHSGEFLTTDGSELSWAAVGGGTGTVTSVGMTVPSFLSVSGSPITTTGTLAVSLSGTALPVANGGTGATTAAGARTNLGAGTGDGSVTSVDADGGSTGLSFTGGPVTTTGVLTLGGTLGVGSGGTGATTASGARTNLGLGSMAIVNDAPSDGTTYGRKDGGWEPTSSSLLGNRIIRKDFHGVTASDELYAYVSSPMVIEGVSILANTTGDLVVDVRKVPIGGFPATGGDSICASAKPTLTADQTYLDTTLTGWDKAAIIGDTYTFHIDSVTTVTDFEITLFGQSEYGELAVSGAFTDTPVGSTLVGSPLTISGGLAPYSLSGSPYSGTRPAGVSIAVSGTDLVATGATTTEASYSWTERVLSTDGQHYDVACSVEVESVSYALWNPSDMGASIILTTGDTVAYGQTTVLSLVRSTVPITGKKYFELEAYTNTTTTASSFVGCGVALSDEVLTSWTGNTAKSMGVWGRDGKVWKNSATVGNAGIAANTQRYSIAVDATARKVWIKQVGAGSWVGGGDPAAGTSPTGTFAGVTDIYASASPAVNMVTVRLVSNPADMTGSPPSGFTAGLPA